MISGSDDKVRFSVVTATYNRAHLLPRCVESVLRQTFPHFEAIVVDDGSTDGTQETVAEYRRRDARVTYLRQEKAGANEARNLGARHAEGEFILVLDSDDEVYPDWLCRLDELIASSGAQVNCCGIEFVDRAGCITSCSVPRAVEAGTVADGLFLSGTYAVKRDVFLELGGFAVGLRAHQSTEFRMRLSELCSQRGYRTSTIPMVLVRAHSHDGPKIRRDPQAKLEASKYILEHHLNKFESKGAVASWLAAAGGCAAELGDYRQAREFFARAICTHPIRWKNYARWMIAFIPLVRRRFWTG